MEGALPFAKKERAITSVSVDGINIDLWVEVPSGHPDAQAYREVLDELASAITVGKAREYGAKGWLVEYNGKEAGVGDCDSGYPPGVEEVRPSLVAVARTLREIENIRVPHAPWEAYRWI
jgi:hypothetical protein